jgi:hypothetical protein
MPACIQLFEVIRLKKAMTIFDIFTVACFIVLVAVFFYLTNRSRRTLLHFTLAAVVFAVANQVGNHGLTIFAVILILAGIAYAALSFKREMD